MAYSTQRAVSDGTLTALALSLQYFDRTEISVYIGGVITPAGSGWTWVGSTDTKIIFNPAVQAGKEVLIRRSTDMSAVRHQFGAGAQFIAEVLDENYTQSLRVSQEAKEGAVLSEIFNDIDMHGFGLRNTRDGTAAQDPATVGQITALTAPAVAAADNSRWLSQVALAEFKTRYLGPSSSAPTADLTGAALGVGAMYFDTKLKVMQVWTGAVWIAQIQYNAGTTAFTPAFGLVSTNVQAALSELSTKKVNSANPATTGSFIHSGNMLLEGTFSLVNSSGDSYLAMWSDRDNSYIHSSYSSVSGFKPIILSVGAGVTPLVTVTQARIALSGVALETRNANTWGLSSAAQVAGSFFTYFVGNTSTSTVAGYIGTDGGAITSVGTGLNFGIRAVRDLILQSDLGTIRPATDGQSNLGSGPIRWGNLYSTSSVINTSDAREKTAVTVLSTAELGAAKVLAKEVGTYRWLAEIVRKGEGARYHVGMTVQRAMEIMRTFGLDPFKYGFICHDSWEAIHNEDGTVTPSGDRYAFRCDELALFIARGFEERIAALETLLKG